MRQNFSYKSFTVFAFIMIVFGILIDGFSPILSGLKEILLISDILITDYIKIGGIGAAFVNSGIVTLITIFLMRYYKLPITGYTYAIIGLMSGFSLFGKNFINIWLIVLGTYLYSKYKKESFANYLNISLLSTALSPLVSSLYLSGEKHIKNIFFSTLLGIIIGFVMPPLSKYTATLHKGFNHYNSGFASGLLALIIVPIMKSYGLQIIPSLHWSTGNNLYLGLFVYSICILIIVVAFVYEKNPLKEYFNLLKSSGQAPCDFVSRYGLSAIYLNIGINGILATSYILLIGGDLNGPTLGGIITIMGFSAYGKHIRNSIPIVFGVYIGAITKQWSLADPSIQIAALFSTTLAPIAGQYGILAGIIAGFIHSSVVLHAGIAYEGVNLYNNGFAGGIVAIVLLPILNEFLNIKNKKGTNKN